MAYSVSQQNTFKESKKEIIKIFKKVFNYVNDSDEFLRSIHNSGAMFQALINADDVESLSKSVEKVKGIQSVISRDNMKCAFFGSTSNGKSTTINALLGDSILPAGVGHTTSCFIEIRGTDPKLGSNSPSVESVGEFDTVLERARESCENKLPTDSLIRIAWPSQKCALLSEDVVILDCPGINLKHDIDTCIDKYCRDADVFVLVVNSVSALNETEKDFFRKVCKKLSKPNVFILNNYWDKCVKDPNHVKIREQHMERSVNFFTEELKCCSETEASSRVFFVSAKEALSKPDTKPLRKGWEDRQSEFKAFKENLEKTLSESATKTKFGAHSSQGKDIVEKVRLIVKALNKKAQEKKDAAVRDRIEMETRCERLASMRSAAHKESTVDISRVSDKVSKMVAEKLQDEVQHLDNIIDKFNHKFSDEQRKLDQYKIDLNKHVVDHFHKIMKELWDNELCKKIEAVSSAILRRYQALVRDKDVSKAKCQSEFDDYVSEFDIACQSISSDFKENISWCNILKRMLLSLIWPSEAKEKSLKAQFWSFMTGKLKPLIAEISKHSAKEATSALKTTLKRLDDLVKKYEKKLQADIAQLKSDIPEFEKIVAKSLNLMNTAPDLAKDLRGFQDKYILM